MNFAYKDRIFWKNSVTIIHVSYSFEFSSELKRNPFSGLYIALEGIDGSGKTTQSEVLKKYLEKEGEKASLMQFPRRDAGVLAEINKNVLSGNTVIPKSAIQYLFSADYSMLEKEEISPRLQKGEIVITDRFHCYSSVAYGLWDNNKDSDISYARSLMIANGLLSKHNQFFVPDLTIYLSVSPSTALKRMKRRDDHDIYEKKDIMESVKRGYDLLLQEFPEEFHVIDAECSIDDVTENMIQILKKSPKKL